MPTVHREDGFEFMIYPNDHYPAHIHVHKAGTMVVLNLGDDNSPPAIREVIGMSRRDVRRALSIAERITGLLLGRWRELHG
ncbi:MAG: DUF4160 domain-containing protein [Anaerolineae bacterium]|nr:DUF4160 domain-containing protein [Anaerolineae bacterium]